MIMIEALSLSSLVLAIFFLFLVFIAIGVYAVFDEKKYKKGKVPFSKRLN